MTAIDDPAAPVARNPRREAQELVGDAFDARVLEPSPPAVVDGDLFADDPVALAGPAGRPVLAPVSSADLTWDQWLGERPERAPWAAARWLGAWRRLPPLPPAYADTRLALHRLVVYVASPARQRVNGKMALRWTFGGLGTPFFGDDEQVRVAGAGLVRQRGPAAEAAEITTLNAAAELVLDGPPDLAWAEQFDAAFDCLPEERRCTFGASPGDAAVPQPYLYVLPWRFDEAPPNAFWNSTSFRGAILPFGHLVDAEDQRALALRFLRRGRALLLEA